MARLRRYAPRQISRTLRKYELVEERFAVGPGVDLQMVAVGDAYGMLDAMVAQESRAARRAERFPYWAEVWPSALGLARWFCTSRDAPAPGSALELGCGLGLVGIALARLGWRVEATDYVEDALVFASHNAAANHVTAWHRVGYLDWDSPVGESVACIVASDVIYERSNHPRLTRVLRHLLKPGGCFYTSDPRRLPARDFACLLVNQGYSHRQYQVAVPWQAANQHVDIHVFRRPLARPASPEEARQLPR